MVYPLLSLEVATPEKKSSRSTLSSIMQESTRKVPTSASQAVLRRMQLTPHAIRRTPDGASRLGQAMSAWSVKIRRAPSQHCRDARVYGHTTTTIHDNDYSHSPPSGTPGDIETSKTQNLFPPGP